MRRDPDALVGREHDVLVVGGGVAGCAVAWEAAARGWSVALVEADDFATGATAGCYRIVHGGLRHLQALDFSGMRASIAERAFFLRALPHLVSPLPCLVPLRRGIGLNSRLAMAVALRINDWVGRHRNASVGDPEQHLPASHLLSAGETLRRVPMLPSAGLSGSAVFFDGLMYSTHRVVLAFARAASRAGAVVVNHARALSVDERGARIRDDISGRVHDVRARVVVDASGPWSGWWGMTPSAPRRYSAGFQIITRPVETSGHLASFTTPAGKRYFAMPWRGRTVWGTADRPFSGDPSSWRIGEEDVRQFLAEIRSALPDLRLEPSDVEGLFGGLRPEGSEASAAAASGRAGLDFVPAPNRPSGVLVVRATKFTTARLLAERAVERIAGRLGRSGRAAGTWGLALPGAVPHAGAYRRALAAAHPQVPTSDLEHLCRLYGADAETLLRAPDLSQARRDFARSEEMAVTDEDLRRRMESP